MARFIRLRHFRTSPRRTKEEEEEEQKSKGRRNLSAMKEGKRGRGRLPTAQHSLLYAQPQSSCGKTRGGTVLQKLDNVQRAREVVVDIVGPAVPGGRAAGKETKREGLTS